MDDPEEQQRAYDDVMTTALDALALVLVAFAAGAAVFPTFGWPSAGLSGLVLFTGVRLADWLRRRAP